VFLILGVVLFRKQLGGLLERLSKFQVRRGQTEISAEAREARKPETEERPELTDKFVSEEKPTEAVEQTLRPEPLTPDEWIREMVMAYISRNIERGEDAFNKAQQAETNAVERLRNEALRLWLRYEYGGDTFALSGLKDMAKQEGLDTSVKHIVYKYMGLCYQSANNFDKAIESFEIAAQVSQTEAERAGDMVEVARCLHKMKQQPEALKRIMHEIGSVTHSDALLVLYLGIVLLYELAENHEFRAIALEKALEIEPNNPDLRFNAAYSYGEKECRSLSLYHYKTLLQFKSDYAMALNNIGVQYDLLQMPISSVNYYKKAIELDETIAMGNLARKYLDAGFEKEASQTVDKARQRENPHPSVGRAMSAISEAKESESQRENKELSVASEQQRYILDFADAYFNEKSDCPSFSGSWRTSDGMEIKIAQKEVEIEGYWTSDKTKYKITGTTVNRGATISIHKEEYVWSSPNKYEFVIDKTGYAYLASGGQKLFIMTMKKGVHTFMELVKAE
jgi:tetratricopeptide (TPR) repeat protein